MQSNKNKLTMHFFCEARIYQKEMYLFIHLISRSKYLCESDIFFIFCCWLFFKRGKLCRQRKREENTKPWHFLYLACKPIWFPLIYRSCFLLSLILTSGIWHLKTFLQSPIFSKSQWSPLGVTFVFVLGCFMVVLFDAPSTE